VRGKNASHYKNSPLETRGSTISQQQTQPCKMAAANDAMVVTCTNNSDYAVICSFFEQFGDKSGLLFPSFHDLQQMLENVEEG
jgi:hypothetical protein